MNRRTFLGTVAGSFLAAPLSLEAQPTRVYRVGAVLEGGPYSGAVDGLRKGLSELGLEESKQVVLTVRDCHGDLTAVEQAARDLERENVDLIYSGATTVTLAAMHATTTVPIVFYAGTDPVAMGLIESFRKPGGRLTGVYGRNTDLTAKRVELLKEMIPTARRVHLIFNPDNPAALRGTKEARVAARQLKVELVERRVRSVDELRTVVLSLQTQKGDAYLFGSDAMVISQSALIIDTVKTLKLPAMFTELESVAQGGLAGFGVSYYAMGRLAAHYVQRILLGASPGTLPVEQVDRLSFVVNLKTAKAMGLTIPRSLLERADQVIE